MKEKLKSMTFKDWIKVTCVAIIPILVVLFIFKGLDNDLWYLLTEGRYIIQHGIYRTDVMSLHSNFDIVVQNWLSAVIFWNIYVFLGSKGIFFFVLIVNLAICYFLYEISMLISNCNKKVSVFVTLFTDVNLALYFIVSRPQILTFVVLLSLMYILEYYVKTNNKKCLKFIPLLSFLEINLHASYWWFIFLFMIPYIIDGIKSKKLRLQGYDIKPIIVIFIISLFVGLINPYGYKSIFFIFNSYGDQYMFKYIYELQPFTFNNLISVNIFAVAVITIFMYIFFREGQIRVRYICLYVGTALLGMINVKSLSLYLLVSTIPVALLFVKDNSVEKKTKRPLLRKVLSVLLIVFTFAMVIVGGIRYYKIRDRIEFNHAASEAVDAIDIFTNKQPASVYVSFNDGGYLEFRGYKSYIDPRAEVFLKKNNHKEDVYKEYYEFETGLIDINEFIKKYNFDFIFVKFGDRLYAEEKINGYFVIYDKIDTLYKVYARNDIVTDDVRKMIIDEYEKAKKTRQEEMEKQAQNQK